MGQGDRRVVGNIGGARCTGANALKILIVHDSQFGNTAQIADAIAQGMRRAAAGAEDHVAQHPIGEVQPEQARAADLLVIGSPTQGFRPTAPVRDLLQRIPRNGLAGKRVATFDTRFTEDEIKSIGKFLSTMVDLFGYAAPRLADAAAKKGAYLVLPPEGFYVGGKEGPLLDGERERAMAWGKSVYSRMQEGARHT